MKAFNPQSPYSDKRYHNTPLRCRHSAEAIVHRFYNRKRECDYKERLPETSYRQTRLEHEDLSKNVMMQRRLNRRPPQTEIPLQTLRELRERRAQAQEQRDSACSDRQRTVENLLFRGRWNDQAGVLLPGLQRRYGYGCSDNLYTPFTLLLDPRHIGMISIGGAIGTGLFLGSGEALKNGGPAGILLGYSIMGTVVYCVNVSIGEMVSFLPNSNGPVGLANRFVDKALGFAMGWNAWYNWTIVLPAEISAASALMGFWNPPSDLAALWPAVFLFVAVAVNCVGVGRYGEIEFWLSTIKVLTIVLIIIIGIILDAGGGDSGTIGFKNWEFPFSQQDGIKGHLGRFFGFFAVMIQAAFAYFGCELPGVVAGEVVNPAITIPIALRLTWIRILLFYVCSTFIAGLLVAPSHERLRSDNTQRWVGSPFIIAVQEAGSKWFVLPHILVALFLISAWSAAAADVYISSRYLYFLVRDGHAPSFLGLVYTNAPLPPAVPLPSQPAAPNQGSQQPQARLSVPTRIREASESSLTTAVDTSLSQGQQVPIDPGQQNPTQEVLHTGSAPPANAAHSPGTGVPPTPTSAKPPTTNLTDTGVVAIPWVGILIAAGFALLSFMTIRGSKATARRPELVFRWLATMTAAAALQSWIGMLLTYIRWYQGISYRERRNQEAITNSGIEQQYKDEIKEIKQNRHWGQPFLAIYAMIMCGLVLLSYGWKVLVTGTWKAFQSRDEAREYQETNPLDFYDQATSVNTFITSYLPIPVFLLLTFGYKLINQTKLVLVEEMKFDRDREARDWATYAHDRPPAGFWRRLAWFLF